MIIMNFEASCFHVSIVEILMMNSLVRGQSYEGYRMKSDAMLFMLMNSRDDVIADTVTDFFFFKGM